MQMTEKTPEQLKKAERLRRRRDKKLARGDTVNTPGRSERETARRKTPEARERAKMRDRIRRKYGKGQCRETLLNGQRCPNGQYLVVKVIDGEEKIYRAHWCFAHIPTKFRERWGVGEFGGDPNHPGRPRKPRPNDVLRELVENEMAEWLAPIRDALLAMKPIVAGNGRHARIEWAPDHRTRLQAVEAALDRVYGKPKQTTDVVGMINLNSDVEVPTDREWELEVARILAESGAVPMSPTAQAISRAQAPANQN